MPYTFQLAVHDMSASFHGESVVMHQVAPKNSITLPGITMIGNTSDLHACSGLTSMARKGTSCGEPVPRLLLPLEDRLGRQKPARK